jgi:coenzyme PQQ precursor peptide PqqA
MAGPIYIDVVGGDLTRQGRIRRELAEQSRREKVKRNMTMAWTTPTLVEICIGLEINGYLPAEI